MGEKSLFYPFLYRSFLFDSLEHGIRFKFGRKCIQFTGIGSNSFHCLPSNKIVVLYTKSEHSEKDRALYMVKTNEINYSKMNGYFAGSRSTHPYNFSIASGKELLGCKG